MVMKLFTVTVLRDRDDPDHAADELLIEAETEAEAMLEAIDQKRGEVVDLRFASGEEVWKHLGFESSKVAYA